MIMVKRDYLRGIISEGLPNICMRSKINIIQLIYVKFVGGMILNVYGVEGYLRGLISEGIAKRTYLAMRAYPIHV